MTKILISLLAIFLIIEEWLWDNILTAFGRSLSKLLNLEQFEQWLSQKTAPMALVAFGIPLLVVTPTIFRPSDCWRRD